MPVKGSYLLIGGIGGVFLWSGIRGKKVTDVFRTLIAGGDPSKLPSLVLVEGVRNPTLKGGTQSIGAATGNQISDTAETYVGFPYLWGGKPALDQKADCSSFVNMIVGWFLQRDIPGFKAGTYFGQEHGPNTLAWLAWNGAIRIPTLAQARPGDIIVWQTHMGIIVQSGPNTQKARMVSDLNPSLGTLETSIDGGSPGGEPFTILRLR